jgi:DNA repair exonuclease SbcCD ATPase subunit
MPSLAILRRPGKSVCCGYICMKLGRTFACVLWFVSLAILATAQTAPLNPPSSTAPVAYSSVSELNLLLSGLEQTSQATQLDLAKLRIEKWKTDANTKRGEQTDVESIQRNLQNAMPEIVTQLRNSPEDMPTTFKLYRNLDALYGVLGSVVEAAGAFGSRDEFQSLQNDLNALERARREFADRMDTLAQSKEGELSRLRAQVQTLQAAAQAAPPPPPKKIIVDDTETPKKTVKKKTTKKPSSSSTQQQKPAANPDSKPQIAPETPQNQPQ